MGVLFTEVIDVDSVMTVDAEDVGSNEVTVVVEAADISGVAVSIGSDVGVKTGKVAVTAYGLSATNVFCASSSTVSC